MYKMYFKSSPHNFAPKHYFRLRKFGIFDDSHLENCGIHKNCKIFASRAKKEIFDSS